MNFLLGKSTNKVSLIPLVSTITYMRAINSVTQPIHKIEFDHGSSITSERAGYPSGYVVPSNNAEILHY